MCTARTFFCLSLSLSLRGVSFIAVEICRFSVSRGPMPPAAITTIVSLPIRITHTRASLTVTHRQQRHEWPGLANLVHKGRGWRGGEVKGQTVTGAV